MNQELARTVLGLPIAVLWPQTLPYLAQSRAATTAVAALSAAYILAPQLPDPSSLLLLVISTAIAYRLWSRSSEESPAPRPRLLTPALITAVSLAIAAALLTDFGETTHALKTVVNDDQVALAVAGFVACVFIGGALVAWMLGPFTKILDDTEDSPDLHSLKNAGRYIGWFERAIIFGFVLGGAPQAAAIALAAKSFARFPTLRDDHEGFAEYFLIGSLGSIAIALGAAVATRAAIGVPLLD